MGSQGSYDHRAGGLTGQESSPKQDMGLSMGSDKEPRAAWNKYLQGAGERRAEPLADLTPTQRTYIENLQAIEKANPKANARDIAMAISVAMWGGRIWNADGKAADVTAPAGLPLVLDYKGGEGYKDVKVSPEQKQAIRSQREIYDKQGEESGVAHTFPAVAAQAGRGATAGAYNTYMVTKGGDLIQDVAQAIIDQHIRGFREAEARDNERAMKIAEEIGESAERLSEALLQHFRDENRGPAS